MAERYYFVSSINFNIFDEESNKMKNENVIIGEKIQIKVIKNPNMSYLVQLTNKKFNNCFIEDINFSNPQEKLEDNNPTKDLETNLYQYQSINNKRLTKQNFKIKFYYIGISINDLKPKELCYLYIRDLIFSLSITNKMFYKLKLDIESFQLDSSLEHAYFDIVMKTVNSRMNFIKKSALEVSTEFSYNSMGNIMFINKLNIDIHSKFLIQIDGVLFSEMISFFKNIKKIYEKVEEVSRLYIRHYYIPKN